MKNTPQQEAFLAAVRDSKSHLALVARAGCGKTSTILLAVDEIVKMQPHAEIAVVAYNKQISVEVSDKLKARGHTDWRTVQSSTLHGMGFGLLRFALGNPKVEDKKVLHLIDAQNADVFENYPSQIAALVRYAKQAGVGFFNDKPIGSLDVWYALADHFDVNGLDDTSEADEVIEGAQRIYRASLAQTDVIDFDDMVLMPLIKNIRVKYGKDFVIVDEAQDLSPARQALARKFMKPHTGRMILVGDDRQAIYGFSGADADALPNMIKQLGAQELPLSVTWRCPKAVVALAQTIVPDIEAAESAIEGEVLDYTIKQFEGEVIATLSKDDAILCRNTAPLITLAYKLIRQGKPCKVEGREIGNNLKALVGRWKVRTIDALLQRLDTYQDREVQKAMAKGNDSKVEEVEDRCMTIREIAQACINAGNKDVASVNQFIDDLFADGATNVTTLCTYHRAKGREFPRVFLWEDATRCPSRAARQDWQVAQEMNAKYVAYTRPQQTLAFVQ